MILALIGTLLGSSPRVRGKRPKGAPPLPCSGLIPACAGKTLTEVARGKADRAHPRVCGENVGVDGLVVV